MADSNTKKNKKRTYQKPLKVLIIDDSLMMQDLLKEILLEERYEVIEAYDGREGYDLFMETEPDLIFLDILMPRQNGILTMQEILNKKKDAKIIMVTSIHDFEMVKLVILKGASGYVFKPFQKNAVLAEIKRVIGGEVLDVPSVD
ncbi:MAG: response regulator [Methanobacteriota archaeon]